MNMKSILLKTVVIGLTASVLNGCATSPLGRKQLLLVSDGQMNQMGIQAYSQMKAQQPLTKSTRDKAYVRCIADHIVDVLGPNQRNRWEVNVFENKSPNAFALPGGKIGVNTGMLNVATTQDQLASVMGHEVGHVLAKHSAERMSIQTATQTGTKLLQAAVGEPTKEKAQLFHLLGLGTQFGIALPFSRTHEAEADVIGLDLMAKAGFDPRASVQLWQNMSKASGGKAPPEFMSTHPSNQTRINGLNSKMTAAMQIYQQARTQGKRPQCRR